MLCKNWRFLDKVKVLSTVSGGSVIGALYALSDEPFSEFEKRIRTILMRGLARPTIRTAFLTAEGPKAVLCWAVVWHHKPDICRRFQLNALVGAILADRKAEDLVV